MTRLQISEKLYGLPFDQFSRQYRVAQIIDSFRRDKKPFAILDVGGYKGMTTEFQSGDDVTVVDLFKDNKMKNYVQTDGKKLPFDDNSFDFVVTFDTYEHVPRVNRKQFLSELNRVAKKGVLLAAPFDDDKRLTTKCEIGLNEYHKKLYKKQHRWLKEHIDYRIPRFLDFEKSLNAAHMRYASIASNELTVWSQLQTLQFAIELDDEYRGRVDLISRFYNRNIDRLDTPASDELSYRRIYFIGGEKAVIAAKTCIERMHTNRDYKARVELILMMMDSFGVKYRDVIVHRNYLEKEVSVLHGARASEGAGVGRVVKIMRTGGEKAVAYLKGSRGKS